MDISKDIKKIIDNVGTDCVIVAATKYVNSFDMTKLLNFGINNFGENRVDAFLEKYDNLKDKNIVWHFIGHLQRNKAAKIINKIDFLHSLDSLQLAKIINDNRIEPLKCFIEINLNKEDNKSGIFVEDLEDFLLELRNYPNVKVVGFMTMSMKFDSNVGKYIQFTELKKILDKVNLDFGLNLQELSMGMSDDYEEALKAGATYVRLGRILWNLEN